MSHVNRPNVPVPPLARLLVGDPGRHRKAWSEQNEAATPGLDLRLAQAARSADMRRPPMPLRGLGDQTPRRLRRSSTRGSISQHASHHRPRRVRRAPRAGERRARQRPTRVPGHHVSLLRARLVRAARPRLPRRSCRLLERAPDASLVLVPHTGETRLRCGMARSSRNGAPAPSTSS